jgi:hypothetical protein
MRFQGVVERRPILGLIPVGVVIPPRGWTSATQLLGVYGSAAKGEGVYLAGQSLRRLLRTIYLCDYHIID